MAQEILSATAVSTPDAFTLGAGSSKVAAVAQPDDSDASYINASVNNTEERFQISAPSSVGSSDTINFVRVVSVARSTSTLSTFLTRIYVDASFTASSSHANVATSYTTFSDDFAVSPATLAAWTLSELSSLFASVRMAANRDLRVTTLYVVVDYTPAATNYTRSVSETITSATDAPTRALAQSRSSSESLSSASDSLSRALALSRSSSESLSSSSDSLSRALTLSRASVESLSQSSDVPTRATALVRVVSVSLSSATDAPTRALAQSRAPVADDALGESADTVSRVVAFSRSSLESLSPALDIVARARGHRFDELGVVSALFAFVERERATLVFDARSLSSVAFLVALDRASVAFVVERERASLVFDADSTRSSLAFLDERERALLAFVSQLLLAEVNFDA